MLYHTQFVPNIFSIWLVQFTLDLPQKAEDGLVHSTLMLPVDVFALFEVAFIYSCVCLCVHVCVCYVYTRMS